MLIKDTVTPFRDYLQETAGLAVTTCKIYDYYLKTLIEHSGPMVKVGELNPPFIRKFLLAYKAGNYNPKKKPCCNNSVNSAIASLAKYEAYLTEEGYVQEGAFMRGIERERQVAGNRPRPSVEGVKDCLAICDRLYPQARGVLAKAVLSVLWHTGVRRCELLGMTLGEIDMKEHRIRLTTTKGNKDRWIEFNTACWQDVTAYLQTRPVDVATHALFVHRRRALGTHALTMLLRDVATVAGYKGDPAFRPHGIRHAAATALDENDADILSISRFLGHTNIETTRLYIADTQKKRQATAEILALLMENPPRPVEREPEPEPEAKPKAQGAFRRRQALRRQSPAARFDQR